ncbi:MAG: phosphate signaling complex protein PhoU [Spirochaetia bacterium]|jgi:phosphate transport system protein
MPIPQLDALKARLVAYARFVEDMIEKSKKALVAREPDTLKGIIDEDEPKANTFEMDLEEECTSLIAQHQPMARDLRTMLMILRITNDLERIGDHAVNIAEAVRDHLSGSPPVPDEGLLHMYEETITMVDCAIRAFIDEDAKLGQHVCETDTTVDSLANEILDRLSTSMTLEPAYIPQSLSILKVAANLERIADLSTNIGEDVIYMTEGRVIKHHRQEEQQ